MKKFAVISLLICLAGSLLATPEEDIAKALEGPLKGYRFNKRLATPGPQDHLLLFTKERTTDVRVVAWTESKDPVDRYAAAPVSPMLFTVYDAAGKEVEKIDQKTYVLVVKLTPDPRIYVSAGPNDYLRVAAAVETIPSPMRVLGPQTVELSCAFSNPLDHDLFFTSENPAKKAVIKPGGLFTLKKLVEVGRPSEPMVVPVDGLGIIQQVAILSANPLSLEVWPQMAHSITIDLANPADSPFRGEGVIHLVTGDGQEPEPFRFPVAMGPGETRKALQVPLNYDGMLPFPIRVEITQRSSTELGKEFVLAETPPLQFVPLPTFEPSETEGLPIAYEGRTQGNAYWSMTAEIPKEGAPSEGRGALVLVYSFKAGGISIKIRPKEETDRAIPASPSGYGLWVYGDQSNNFITCGIRDASGRVFQPDPIKLNWKGWRYQSFRLPKGMREPLQWDSAFELINGKGEENGAVFINNPSLLYELPELAVEPETPGVQAEEEPEIVDRRNEVPSAIPIYNLPPRPADAHRD